VDNEVIWRRICWLYRKVRGNFDQSELQKGNRGQGQYKANGEVTVPKTTLFRVNSWWRTDGWMGGNDKLNLCAHRY